MLVVSCGMALVTSKDDLFQWVSFTNGSAIDYMDLAFAIREGR